MKIGLLSTFPPQECGVGIYANYLLNELKNIEQVVTIGTDKSKADYVIDFSSNKLDGLLKEIVEKEKIELLHIQYNAPHFGKFSLNAGLRNALKKASIPYVVTLHEVQYPQKLSLLGKLRFSLLKFIEKEIVTNAKHIIVHTPNQARFLKKTYKVESVSCIHHGLILMKNQAKKAKNVIFFGIITPAKGVHLLVEAMKQIPEFTLVIAGNISKENAEYREQLENQIKGAKNVSAHLRWITEEEKWDFFKEANIVALPYTWAPYQSGVLHNAISLGLPVVVSRVGALHELAEQFQMGEVIESNSSSAIVEGIKKVHEKYESYQEGIEKYRNESNWAAVAKKHSELYRSVL